MLKSFVCVLLSLLMLAAASAQDIESDAAVGLIMDFETGDVLWSKNPDTPIPPASIAKLMTAALLFERLKSGELSLDDTFTVSERAWGKGGSKMWVLVDSQVRIEDLLRGVIVQSGNDASIVIAEGIAGTEDAFADLMNEKARDLGMRGSVFRNATGWPDAEQRMSARDIAILARHIIEEYPDYYGYYSEREFTWSKITQRNRNPLLYADIGADGLKTGYTREAGYGVVGSAQQNGERRIVVVHGLETEKKRREESERLVRMAFTDFKKYPLYKAGDLVAEAKVWNGHEKTVPLMTREDVNFISHRLSRPEMKVELEYESPAFAPIEANEQIGVLRVTAPGATEKRIPLYAASAVAEKGFFGKVLGAGLTLLTPSPRAEAAPADAE